MKYCTKCGKEHDDSMNFCTNCGAQLIKKESGGQQKPTFIKKEKTHKNGIISKILIALVIAGVVAFLVYNRIEANKQKIEQNKLMAFAKYVEIGQFGGYGVDGLALVEIVDGNRNYYYGFINKKYEEVIPCIYQRIEPFKGEQTIVRLNDKYALMNKKGEIEQLKYTEIGNFTKEGYAKAKAGDYEYYFINRKGKTLSHKFDSFDDPSEENNWRCHEGICLLEVSRNGKYGFVDKRLNEVVPCEYKNFSTYQQYYFDICGLIKVEKDGLKGCVNWDGNIVIPIKYKSLWANDAMDEGYYNAQDTQDKWGVINAKGNTIIPFIYDNYETRYGEIKYWSKKYGKWDFYDKSGNYIKTVYK